MEDLSIIGGNMEDLSIIGDVAFAIQIVLGIYLIYLIYKLLN